MSVLVRVSNAEKRYHDHSNSYKEYLLEVAASSFRGILNYHGRKHGGWVYDSVQADMLLENSTSLPKGIRNWTEIMGLS